MAEGRVDVVVNRGGQQKHLQLQKCAKRASPINYPQYVNALTNFKAAASH